MSFMSRAAELVLRLQGFKRQFSSAERMHRLIAKDRRNGPALPSTGMRRRVHIDEQIIAGRQVFFVAPPSEGTGTRVVYFHGGSYVLDLIKYHWHMVERLVVASGATLVVPRYPLAPEAAHHEVLAFARTLYDVVRPDVLFGDSAGAGLALALTQVLRDARQPLPRRLILQSPWLDVTCSDPRVAARDGLDPMIGIPGSVEAGRLYARNTDARDPRISPIFGSFDDLPPITVLAGTHDILYADAERLRERVPDVDWIEGSDMIHDWPLVVQLPEARAAIAQMAERIRRA